MLSSSLMMMARTMGTIIIVAAVFDIHMERNQVATMKPMRILNGWTPKRRRMRRAILLWSSHRCMARATMKPPIKRKMIWLK